MFTRGAPVAARPEGYGEVEIEVKNGRGILRYKYDDFLHDVLHLANQLNLQGEDNIDAWKPDAIICIARGGYTAGVYLGHKLNVKVVADVDQFLGAEVAPKLQPKTQGKKHHYILIDDMSDSGNTLQIAREALEKAFTQRHWNFEITTVTLWIRETTIFIPDYFARVVHGDTWIDFPWEADLRHRTMGYFLELMGLNRQFYTPSKYLSIRPLSDREIEVGAKPFIGLTDVPEHASVFEDIAEVHTVLDELTRNLDDHPELQGMGQPMVTTTSYDQDVHAKFWRTFKA